MAMDDKAQQDMRKTGNGKETEVSKQYITKCKVCLAKITTPLPLQRCPYCESGLIIVTTIEVKK